jgi:type I restriction enzyme M protein
MLISALAEVKRKKGEHRTLRLYGQERNHMTAAIARMNLVLHGVDADDEGAERRGAVRRCDQEVALGGTTAVPGRYECPRARGPRPRPAPR